MWVTEEETEENDRYGEAGANIPHRNKEEQEESHRMFPNGWVTADENEYHDP